MKISVIMASYLGEYPGCAKDRDKKFLRAVQSFLYQVHEDKELIIVSDGCEITNGLYKHNFEEKYSHQIKLIKLEKQVLFSGSVRQAGIDQATGEIICFLDSDDYFLNHHLKTINDNFRNNKWVVFSDYYKHPSDGSAHPRRLEIKHGSMGTSNIAYRRDASVSWTGCDGYGHDWLFIKKLLKIHREHRIYGASYVVCHIPGQLDQ